MSTVCGRKSSMNAPEMLIVASVIGAGFLLLKLSIKFYKYLLITAAICVVMYLIRGDSFRVYPLYYLFWVVVGVLAIRTVMFFVGIYEGMMEEKRGSSDDNDTTGDSNEDEDEESDFDPFEPTNVVYHKDGRTTFTIGDVEYMEGFKQTWVKRGNKYISLRNA